MTNILPCVEIGSTDATHSVIWLHGLGADGHDFEPIVNELILTHNIRFIFPHAPSIPVSINNDMVMPATTYAYHKLTKRKMRKALKNLNNQYLP